MTKIHRRVRLTIRSMDTVKLDIERALRDHLRPGVSISWSDRNILVGGAYHVPLTRGVAEMIGWVALTGREGTAMWHVCLPWVLWEG